jgi:hypothetical protein
VGDVDFTYLIFNKANMDRRNFLETSLTIGAGGMIAPSLLIK